MNKYITPLFLSILSVCITIIIIACMFINFSDRRYSIENSSYNTISIRGSAERRVDLDMTSIKFSVSRVDTEGEAANIENTKVYDNQIEDIRAEIAKSGLDNKDTKVQIVEGTLYSDNDTS